LLHILYRWRDWAGEEEPKKWVQKVVSDDKKLVEFLEKSLQRTFRFSSLDAVGQVQYRLDPEWLRPFLDPSEIIDRVRRLFDKGDLSENQKIALRQFIQEYEIRQRGMDPNDPLAWEAK
ncbi:MAG: NTPase KAP, partial [Deltaproteobacteria bacterium]